MTTVAEQTPTLLPAQPRPQTPKALIAVLVVVVLIATAVLGYGATQLRAAVARERSSLRNARAVEAAAERTLRGVHTQTDSANDIRKTTEANDQLRIAERDAAQTALVKIEQSIALINIDLANTKAAQNQVALYSAPRDACVQGVRTATTALRHGNSTTVVTALKAADAACSAALAAVTGARYPYDFPDPSVIEVGSRYYAYSTNSGVGNIQVLVSTDLERWTIVGDALAGLPTWAAPGATWAPAVFARGTTFVAYYTTREIATGRQCISVAVANAPVGPFVDHSTAPFVCDTGGSIDPSPFVDEAGVPWLHWKSEAIPAAPTILWARRLRDDGLAFVGAPAMLLSPGQHWEHGVVEGPSMVRINGHDYLFYSGGFWTTAGYAQGVASCDGPAGPCRRILTGPVLASAGRVAGPGGGGAFTTANGDVWLAFHAFTEPNVGYPNSRTLHLATVRVVSGIPVVTQQ